MGKDLHNDNFEDFIKKNLESFDDEPSDAMWERIAPIIPPKPGINWQGYVLPTALVFSVVLLMVFGVKIYQYKTTSENLTKALERSKNKIEALENSNSNTNVNSNARFDENSNKKINTNTIVNSNINTDNNINSKANTGLISSKVTKTRTSTISTSKAKENMTEENNSFVLNEINLSNQKAEVSDGNILNLSKISQENIEIPPFKIDNFVPSKSEITNQNIIVKPLATLQLKPIFPSVLYEIPNANYTLNKSTTTFSTGQSITLFIAPTVLKNNIRPSKGGGSFPSKPNQKEMINMGKSIGLKYNRDLNEKWSLTVGGIFTNVSYDFHSKHNLKYDKDTEQDFNIDKVSNNIDYSGSSTYGEYSVGLDITRLRNSAISQDEAIDIELDATADVKSIAIPIYATYNLFHQNKLSIGLKGGVSYNKLISNKLAINDFKINKEGFEIKDVALKDSPKPTQKNSFNAITGLSLNYQVINNWSISVEPTWSAALSDNNRGLLGRTKSSTFGLEIGLKYGF